ncbi:MAG: LpxD N-terminal domain-containing protein, partial [Salinisphaeraceae bacterium]|nr:LpxD N-terminal domain-containing protein [Salinisphaeraceae bacterium]
MEQAFTLGELAERFGLELHGDAAARITDVCTLTPGSAGALAFISSESYLKQLESTQATAILLSRKHAEDWQGNALVSENPHADFARIASLFDPAARAPKPSAHASAYIDSTAQVDASCEIASAVFIGAGSKVEADCYIGP